MKASSEEIYEKSMQGTLRSIFSGFTTLLLAIRAYIHSFICCCVQNLRNPARFSQKFELIAVQGHPRSSRCQPKAKMQSLLHRVSKNKQNYFCYNCVKLSPNLTIFGAMMAIVPNIMTCTHFPPHLIHVNPLPC